MAPVFTSNKPSEGTRADYVFSDRSGRLFAVLDAKHASADPIAAQDQGKAYAERLDVRFEFLSNGEDVCFFHRPLDAETRGVD